MKLNDENVPSGLKVKHEGEEYVTGNRYHSGVELFSGKEFVRTIDMSEMEILDKEAFLLFNHRRLKWAEAQMEDVREELTELTIIYG